jgi:type IV secretory pathway VirB2 component (pilin)
MKIRKLRGDDLFLLLPIIAKLDVKDELVSIMDKGSSRKKGTAAETRQAGIEAMASIVQKALSNLGAIKDDLNELLANLTGSTAEKIAALSLSSYVGLVISLFKSDDIKEVFTSAATLLTETKNTK